MAQSVFLLHLLHGGASRMRCANGAIRGVGLILAGRPRRRTLVLAPGTRRALPERPASRIEAGAFRRRHVRPQPSRRQSLFPSG